MTKLYSIKDNKIGFNSIFAAPNDNIAKRILFNTVNSNDNIVHTFPNDFALYELGDLNENSGEIKSEINFICEANELLKKGE